MLRKDLEDLHMNGEIGDWCFCNTNQGLLMFLRYPVPEDDWARAHWPQLATKGDIVRMPLSGDFPMVWQWDGNRDTPTLAPSILVKGGQGERWHGFLRAGKLETV